MAEDRLADIAQYFMEHTDIYLSDLIAVPDSEDKQDFVPERRSMDAYLPVHITDMKSEVTVGNAYTLDYKNRRILLGLHDSMGKIRSFVTWYASLVNFVVVTIPLDSTEENYLKKFSMKIS